MTIARPDADEHSAYFGGYVALVTEADVLDVLEAQMDERRVLLAGLDAEAARHRYEPGKWSVKELLGHLLDCERVLAYRGLVAARDNGVTLPGFDQDAWMTRADFHQRSLPSLLDELDLVRGSTLALFASLDDTALAGRVRIEGSPTSARAVPWIVAGHERHHMTVLRERYL